MRRSNGIRVSPDRISASYDADVERARQQLKTNPVKVIEAAKEGSLIDMTALSLLDDANEIPKALHPLIEGLLTHHIRVCPPDHESPNDITSSSNRMISLCFAILHLFSGNGRYFDDAVKQRILLDLWPNIFRWLNYLAIRLAEPELVGAIDGEDASFVHLLAISQAFISISKWPSTANEVLSDLDAFRLAASVWADPTNSTKPQKLRCSADCLISFRWCDRKESGRFDILSDILGGESNVSAHALRRLRISHSDDPSAISSGYNDYDAIAAQVSILYLLCGGDETCYHSLRRTVLWDGALGLVIDLLSKLTIDLKTRGKASGAVCECLKFISLIFLAADAAVWTRYALRHRVIEVLWGLGPFYDRLTGFGKDKLTETIMGFCRFLNIGKTRSVAFDAFCKIGSEVNSAPVEFVDTWKVLRTCLLSRCILRCINTRLSTFGAEVLCCSNPACDFSGHRRSFKTCAGCKSTLYCSRKCQTQGWRDGRHREECGAIRKQGRTTIFSIRDKRIVTRIALAEIRRHIPGLRVLAARNFPNVTFEHLNIHVDLSAEPAILSVEPAQRPDGTAVKMKHRIGDHMMRVARARQQRGDKHATFVHIKFEDGSYCSPGHLYLATHISKALQFPTLAKTKSLRKAAVDYDDNPLPNWLDEIDELVKIVTESSTQLRMPVWNELLMKSVIAVYIADKDSKKNA